MLLEFQEINVATSKCPRVFSSRFRRWNSYIFSVRSSVRWRPHFYMVKRQTIFSATNKRLYSPKQSAPVKIKLAARRRSPGYLFGVRAEMSQHRRRADLPTPPYSVDATIEHGV